LNFKSKRFFQRSWAEANHALAYKAPADLTVVQRRVVAFSAAQAWGVDRTFQGLESELNVFEAGGAASA
jgi:putative GTP pyrophosphokinase